MAEEKKLTRKVYAILLLKNEQEKAILLSDPVKGAGWHLPGGSLKSDESDFDGLIRVVQAMTGLEIEPNEQIGEPLRYGRDLSLAYSCTIVGGQLVSTRKAFRHRYCSAQELKQGHFIFQHTVVVDGVSKVAEELPVPLKLPGVGGRLSRMGRMVWDGLSLLQDPIEGPNEAPEEFLPIEGVFVSEDKCFLVDETSDGQKKYPRLDPYSPTGKMEPQPK